MIRRKCRRLIILLNSICSNHRSTKCPSENKDVWKISNREVYLLIFKVILKYPRISEKLLPTYHPSSISLMLVEDIGPSLNENAKKGGICNSAWENVNNKIFFREWNNHYTVAALLSELGASLQKNIALCNTLQWNASKLLFNVRLTQEEREKWIQISVSWQRQTSY